MADFILHPFVPHPNGDDCCQQPNQDEGGAMCGWTRAEHGDAIDIGDRVSFQWDGRPRRFGVVRDIMRWQDTIRYSVQVDDHVHIHEVWAADITKECG